MIMTKREFIRYKDKIYGALYTLNEEMQFLLDRMETDEFFHREEDNEEENWEWEEDWDMNDLASWINDVVTLKEKFR